ncbi:DUF2905 domain-containing protein [candidate division KSB1 bacterium]|nr:DUF2905 domain-containing protein [candidate division KSB1 bacterium]
MNKTLIYIGIVIILIGLLWQYLGKIPIGRLPGDLVIKRPNFRLYFPITSMILISILISLIIRWFRK